MDVFLAIVAGLLIISGIIGSVVPVIPGPPLGFFGLLVLHFTAYANFSLTFLIVFGIIAMAITVVDYFVPAWGTKKFGGTKYGRNGSMIGIFAGLFLFPPIGIILGPFIGAFIGELIHDSSDTTKALKSGFGSFVGFLLGTGLKLIISIIFTYYYIVELFT